VTPGAGWDFPRNEGVPGSSPGVGFLFVFAGSFVEPGNLLRGVHALLSGSRVQNGYVKDPFSVSEVVPKEGQNRGVCR
jgi:hypothetical protein